MRSDMAPEIKLGIERVRRPRLYARESTHAAGQAPIHPILKSGTMSGRNSSAHIARMMLC